MTFFEECKKDASLYDQFESTKGKITTDHVHRALEKSSLSPWDFYVLLSPTAEQCLESMAQRSLKLTIQNFGKVIFLYTPLYAANFCVNQCVYCGFNVKNKIARHKLTPEELEREAQAIATSELRHILLLTGESRQHSPVEYIRDCVRVLRKYFTSISIEIYPLEEQEYADLIAEGVDGITIYQEVYDPGIYDEVHVWGPKKDYRYRLEAPERACRAGMRAVNIGPLLGLGDNWRREAFITGMHADYLQDQFLDAEVSISLPRLRPFAGSVFQPKAIVTDKNLVQTLLALRLFLPRAGMTLSTRESQQFRNNLLRLGITRMSAGSNTAVGGRTCEEPTEVQFDISDTRSVSDMHRFLLQNGYQPVYKDWQDIQTSSEPGRVIAEEDAIGT